MDDFEVIQVINNIALEVRNFKRHRNRQQWQWSCLVCGDSKVDRSKARFGVTKKQGAWVCNCFNCGYSTHFNQYIKHFHPKQYDSISIANFNSTVPQMYDLNYLIEGAVESKKLVHLFYINKYSNAKHWLNVLSNKKIILKQTNVKKLYTIHKEYWNDKAHSMV